MLVVTGWVSNSILSTVKTMLISLVFREKNQRLEVVRGVLVHCIYQLVFRTPNDSNTACDGQLSFSPLGVV